MGTGLFAPGNGRGSRQYRGDCRISGFPGGILWVVVTLNLSALIFLLQQAGITLIAAASDHHQYLTALNALWGVTRKFLSLLKISLFQVFTHLLIALPFIALTGFAWTWLINLYDPYLLRLEKPPNSGCFSPARSFHRWESFCVTACFIFAGYWPCRA